MAGTRLSVYEARALTTTPESHPVPLRVQGLCFLRLDSCARPALGEPASTAGCRRWQQGRGPRTLQEAGRPQGREVTAT